MKISMIKLSKQNVFLLFLLLYISGIVLVLVWFSYALKGSEIFSGCLFLIFFLFQAVNYIIKYFKEIKKKSSV